MIPVEAAVLRAIESLPSFLGGRKPQGVRVEEVLPPSDNDTWKVTLSYLEPGAPPPETALESAVAKALGSVKPPVLERVLRVITVEASSGHPRSMTLRQAG